MAGLCEGGNEPACSLKAILVEKKLVKELMSDQVFKDRVFDNFSTKKTHRLELMYKKIKERTQLSDLFGRDSAVKCTVHSWSQATKGNIEGGEFDPVLWIEFGVVQWSERLSYMSPVVSILEHNTTSHIEQFLGSCSVTVARSHEKL
ncbi:hypothetical protein ANN_26640 [Periplaneta americana]|uniref:Uncharacterized protein n=1 Tax=Periplaneta americana TaxID=6978 RepID=A0ABQ8RYT3_PERAM|nr:hypothetical protein ANN_26640 [Periplaneta americana]